MTERRDLPGPGPEAAEPAVERTFIERRGMSPAVFGLLCVAGLFLCYNLAGSGMSALVFGFPPDLGAGGGFRAFMVVSQVLLLLVPAFFAARLAAPDVVEFLRLPRPRSWAAALPALAGIFSLQQMLQVYLVFQARIPLPAPLDRLVEELRRASDALLLTIFGADTAPELVAVLIAGAVVPGITEEIAFRGLVQRSLERGLGPAAGIAVTGLLFGAFHLNPFALVPLTVLGMYLGFLAWRAGSVWVSVIAHAFNNSLPAVALYAGVMEASEFSGGLTDLPGGSLLALLAVSAAVFVLSTMAFLRLTAPASDRGEAAPA